MKLKVLESLHMIHCNHRRRDQAALSNCCLCGVHFEINPVKQWNFSLNHTHKIFTCLCFPLFFQVGALDSPVLEFLEILEVF